MASKTLTPEDYATIDKYVGLKPGEYYSVVTQRLRGKLVRSIHVFSRAPNQAELTAFEDTASKVAVRGRKTEFQGSQAKAYSTLYDRLIARAYDVVVGFEIKGEIVLDATGSPKPDPSTGRVGLTRDEAIEHVQLVTKREALRDSIQEVYSEGRMVEMEGDDEEVVEKKREGEERA